MVRNTKDSKRYLVLGGSGLIGQWLVPLLADQGHSVIAVRSPASAGAEESGVYANDARVTWVTHDLINDFENFQHFNNIDTVYHLLWTQVPVTSEKNPIADFQSNLFTTIRIAEECTKNNIPRLVFFSSGGTVYGESTSDILNEEDATNPISSHGVVKLTSEKFLLAYSKKNNLDVKILRPSNVYGRTKIKDRKQGLIEVAMKHAIQGTQLDLWGDPNAVRDYVHAKDVAHAAYKVDIIPNPYSTYNIGTGVGTSTSALLEIIEKATKQELVLRELGKGSPQDVTRNVLSIDKAKRALDWSPEVELTQGIAQLADIFVPHEQEEASAAEYCLAICTPYVGAISESFIRRNIEHLAPHKTVVITAEIIDDSWLQWPCYVTQFSDSLIPYAPEEEERVVAFLKKHGVTHILSEYGCFCIQIVELNQRRLHLKHTVQFLGGDASARLRDPATVEYYRWMGTKVDKIVTVARTMADRLKAIGMPAEKLAVIPCGIEVPDAPIASPERSPCRFVSVTRMVPKKGPLYLLQAFQIALRTCPDITLDIVGDGVLFDQVKSFVNSDPLLSNAVKLHGSQQHEFVQNLIKEAGCYVQHSITDPDSGDAEGMPVVILESSAAGLPVISTFHEGIPDSVAHGASGYLVEERDVDSMAQYIIRMAQEPEKRKEFGITGWKKMKSEFSRESTLSDLRDQIGIPQLKRDTEIVELDQQESIEEYTESLNKAVIELQKDNVDDAARLLRIDHPSPAFELRDLEYAKALCLLQLGRPIDAQRALEKEVQAFPDNHPAYELLRLLPKSM